MLSNECVAGGGAFPKVPEARAKAVVRLRDVLLFEKGWTAKVGEGENDGGHGR